MLTLKDWRCAGRQQTRRRQETKFENAKSGSETPRDSQIGVVAELSPGCSFFNYTSHIDLSHYAA